MRKGDLAIRVPIVRDDEIGRLASSFNEMSVALQRMRDEARGANPLTGLPGNITIAKYIDECLNRKRTICVLYCDLTILKPITTNMGLQKEMRRYSILATAWFRGKTKGHEGHFRRSRRRRRFRRHLRFPYWEEYAKVFITLFDRGIYQFYNSVDARNGFIESVNRKGERQRFPLMSVSVAVVSNKLRKFTNATPK